MIDGPHYHVGVSSNQEKHAAVQKLMDAPTFLQLAERDKWHI
jgi:hypothetical protein